MGTVISSRFSFEELTLTSDGPEWKTVAPGINIDGICRNRFCQAKNDAVEIQIGFYDSTGGICRLDNEITQLKCPMCKQRLDKNEVQGVGVYRARLQVTSKVRGYEEVVENVEAWNKYLFASCVGEGDEVRYEDIVLKVERLPWYSFLF